jgi:hypothetical protein
MRWLKLVPALGRGLAAALAVGERAIAAPAALHRGTRERAARDPEAIGRLRSAFPSQRAQAAKLRPYLEFARIRIRAL